MKVVVLASGSDGNSTFISSGNHKILIDLGRNAKYIKEHLKTCPRIELWRVGLGDKSTAIIEKCSKNILSKEKIKELWGKDGLCQSACLVVYNS